MVPSPDAWPSAQAPRSSTIPPLITTLRIAEQMAASTAAEIRPEDSYKKKVQRGVSELTFGVHNPRASNIDSGSAASPITVPPLHKNPAPPATKASAAAATANDANVLFSSPTLSMSAAAHGCETLA
eukprot:scaffold60024_cov43-Prasinocladus_malaysianus.AAC.2